MIGTAPAVEAVIGHLRQNRAVPVYRELLSDLETPVSAYLKLAGDGPAFLLESAEPDESVGRYSFVGSDPYMLVAMRDGTATFTFADGGTETVAYRDPLRVVARQLAKINAVSLPELPAFQGGAIGYLGYEAVESFERLPHTRADDVGLPDVQLMFVDTFVMFDNVSRTQKLVTLAHPSDDPQRSYQEALKRLDQLAERLGSRPASLDHGCGAAGPVETNMSKAEFAAMVRQAKEYIAAGDIIQVVLSQRLKRRLAVHPFAVYRHLRQLNPSPYMYFLQLPDMHVCGASPEMLVRVRGSRMRTVPVAGSRWRGKDRASDDRIAGGLFEGGDVYTTDAAGSPVGVAVAGGGFIARPPHDRIAEELLEDEKEVAEHVMLVDLARNDLGRVAVGGSVSVTRLLEVDRFSHVMHIVSHVDGSLSPAKSGVDALRSCFPAGTLSGAPKIRAMEIIDELEPTRRGVYGGAVGYFAYSGDLDTAIGIRTMVVRDGIGYVQAGGGIVADSEAEYEFNESMNKAAALLAAIDRAHGASK
ncbi:MAG: anthranilate synthase component I [Chloroflexi bacterium]|nr:anthranilate synthase component I [Chloroflexota bacterium]